MSSLSLEEIKYAQGFVAELALPEEHEYKLPVLEKMRSFGERAIKDDAPAAAANAGSLVSFVGGLLQQNKEDVLNSTLLAQLAATKKYDRYKQTKDWYDFYINVLANVGWVVPAFAFRGFTPTGSSFKMNDAVLQILSAIATGSELAILTATMKALEENKDNQDAVVLFDSQSFPETSGNFQILPVSEDRGDIVMALSAMQFTANKHVTNFLWWKWTTTEVNIFQSAQKAVLNNIIYSKVRQEVINKLGDKAKTFIKDIEI